MRYFIKSLSDETHAKAVQFLAGRGLKYKIFSRKLTIRAYDLPVQVQEDLRKLGCVVEEDNRRKKDQE